jgi:hypothetical protein
VLKGDKQAHFDALKRLIASQPNTLALAAPAPPSLALSMAPVPATIAPTPALEVAPVPARTMPVRDARELTLARIDSMAPNA